MAQQSTGAAGCSPAHANLRGVDDFGRAYRHSQHVSILKKALPAIALIVVFIFIALALTAKIPFANLIVDEIGLKQGKLVMENPKMEGFDKNSRPYDVKAAQAIQDLASPGKVLLKTIDAKLPMDASSFANIDAISGVFDTGSERLVLDDQVTIKGARGMDLSLMNADIDIKSGTMESADPVIVKSDNTDISADSVRVEDNGNRILFNKRVKMTIIRPVTRGVTESGN